MKFPDLVHAAKPEPHFAMPQAGTAHDTFWDFASLMPEITHMLMWAMSDRAIPRSYRTMQGFGVHTFRLVNAGGRVALRQVPLDAEGRHALAGVGRGGQDLRRRSRFPSPRSVGGDRGGRVSRVRARACRSSPRSRPRGSPSTCSTRPRSFPRNWCRSRRSDAGARTATRTTSLPRPSRSRSAPRTSCRASTSPTIRCWPAASTPTWTRRSRGWAARTSTRSRSTRRSRRCTTTSATACTGRRFIAAACPTSRIRSAAAARSRPARRRVRVVPGAAPGRRPQGARQGRAVRRSLHAGDALLEQPDRRSSRRTSSTRSASSCRACRRRRSASGWCRAC